jgi:hypothetical protein
VQEGRRTGKKKNKKERKKGTEKEYEGEKERTKEQGENRGLKNTEGRRGLCGWGYKEEGHLLQRGDRY